MLPHVPAAQLCLFSGLAFCSVASQRIHQEDFWRTNKLQNFSKLSVFSEKKIKSQTLKLRVCFLLCVFLIAGTKFETAYIFILYHTTKAMLKERKKCFDVCFKKKIAKNDAVLYFISSGGRRVSQREWSWRCLMMKDTIFILVIGKPGNNFYGCINISSLFLHIYI